LSQFTRGRDVAAVCGSGEFAFFAASDLGGAKLVDVFDSNPIACPYAEVNLWQKQFGNMGVPVNSLTRQARLVRLGILHNKFYNQSDKEHIDAGTFRTTDPDRITYFPLEALDFFEQAVANNKKYGTIYLSNIIDWETCKGTNVKELLKHINDVLEPKGSIIITSSIFSDDPLSGLSIKPAGKNIHTIIMANNPTTEFSGFYVYQ
jgi:hypothetical protein